MSSDKDKKRQKLEEAAKRRAKRNCAPTDNTGDRYVTGMEGQVTQGKGSKYRVIEGWYSDEMTKKFNRIFKRRHKEYEDNKTETPPVDYAKKKTK
tara:strand:- start:289 stop:573 length:285 start_codon:yes stop_codon:yes gene_type:complete